MRDFKIERARSASLIWNHKYDFRRKLHDPKFNYHFIRSILKSHNFMALNVLNIPSRANSGTGNAFTSYLVCKTMSCDENSLKHNKQTRRSENENSLFHASKFDSRRLNQWWKTFLSPVVEAETSRCLGEGIWGCSRCNSAMDFFSVVKLPRLHDGQLWRVFSFKYRSMALCTILRDSSPLVCMLLFVTSA